MEHLSLSAAGRHFAIDNKPVSPSTVFRWIRDGVRTDEGRVYLQSLRLGRRLVTTPEFITEFKGNLVGKDAPPRRDEPPALPSTGRTATQRQRDIERAERRLAKMGM